MDDTRVYFGDDLTINGFLTIRQPTVYDIVNIGDSDFWQFISMFCANASSLKLMLHENGIDWNEISDFEVFCMLLPLFTPDKTSLIIKDIDFTKLKAVRLQPEEGEEEGKLYLIDMENPEILIDETIYKIMVARIRDIFDYHPKDEFAKDRFTKEILIDEERQKIRMNKRLAARNKKKSSSYMKPLLSFALNHPGFKYKKDELREVKIAEFMDSVARLQQYEKTVALMQGMYFGMIDWDNNPKLKDDLNLLKDV